jgi:hypothetical protein
MPVLPRNDWDRALELLDAWAAAHTSTFERQSLIILRDYIWDRTSLGELMIKGRALRRAKSQR